MRRFWEPAFVDSRLNLAGWAKRVTGKAAMTVGSVGLDGDFIDRLTAGASGTPSAGRMDWLVEMIEEDEVDLVAVGRALLADPLWVEKLRDGRTDFDPFVVGKLASLT